MKEADSKGRPGRPDPATGNEPSAAPQKGSPPSSPARGAPTDIQAYIGTRLREVYDDVASQPIPDRFIELMRELDRK
jgi:hypothetical protein